MEYIFPTLLASILLFFILFFIKTGLSQIGNVITALLSFILVLIVLLLRSIFPLWQACLLVLLLGLCVTYLLQTRFSHRVFAAANPEDVSSEAVSEEDAYSLFLDKYKDKYESTSELLFEKTEPTDEGGLEELLQRNKKEEGPL